MWIVNGLYNHSNAEKAGLQINDQIIAVNGKDVCEIPFRERKKYFNDLNNAELTIKRNEEIKVIQLLLKPVLQ
jgi:S1-C subfamily serine protease